MGRHRRIVREDLVYHVVKRGNNKNDVFFEDLDYLHYLNCLERYKKKYKFCLFAFCLMKNHVHLLIKTTKSGTISKIMQSLTLAHIRFYNKKYNRCGHVWQGRFCSSIVGDDDYLLNCMRYIEQNPLRAGFVSSIGEYFWSSYKLQCRNTESRLLDRTKNHLFIDLGVDTENRILVYKKLMKQSIDQKGLEEIRDCINKSDAYMSDRFKEKFKGILPKKKRRGRPCVNLRVNRCE